RPPHRRRRRRLWRRACGKSGTGRQIRLPMSVRDQQELLLEAAFRTGSFDQVEQSARAAERSAQLLGRHGAVARARVQLGMIRHYESVLRSGGLSAGGTDAAGADGAGADVADSDVAAAEE